MKRWYTPQVRILVYFTSLLLILTITMTSRTYQAKPFNVTYALSECKVINEGKDLTRVKTPNGEFLVKKSKIVNYIAPDKDSEVLEIHGEHRLYSYTAPDLLYYLYYLRDKEDTTETAIGVINVSKAE
jgi:hypothetical protein